MSLVEHAEKELNLCGLLDVDSDYDGLLGHSALEIVRVFADQGHSGASAYMVIELVGKLLRFEPLTPLTYGPEEWTEVAEGLWQNKRQYDVFSKDGGKTHY